MALLQAIIAFLTRSLGRIVNAIFGWAVVALFGRTSSREQVMLSVLVAAAAAWPVLLAGIVFPHEMSFVVAFVPLAGRVPAWIVRIIWITLALAVPIAVGLAVAAKAPPGTPAEPFAVRALRGFPITLGIAGAFLLMFATVPFLRITSMSRRRKDAHMTAIPEGNDGYAQVAHEIDRVVAVHGIDVERAPPPWWLAAPSRLLAKLGGKAFRGFAPEYLAYWRGPELELALYPSDLLMRGTQPMNTRAHGLFAEALVHTPALMTFDADAQALERQVRQIWQVLDENPHAHESSRMLLSRLGDVRRELATLHVEFDEWQVVYREAMQLERALRGVPQLLASLAPGTEAKMKDERLQEAGADRPLVSAPSGELVVKAMQQTTALVRKEIELAKAEVRADLKRELGAAKGLGVAGVCALTTLNLILVALVLALGGTALAALGVAVAVLLIGSVAGIVGWGRRVRKPLERTQRTLKEDVQWTKERLA